MIPAIDTSVLVAAIVEAEGYHAECGGLLDAGRCACCAHGLTEAFNTLTGGRRFRMRASLAASILEEDYAPSLRLITLTPPEILRALRVAESRGVRGGAVFDYLHLLAARKAKASRLYTLNVADFLAIRRPGDPEIVHPGGARA